TARRRNPVSATHSRLPLTASASRAHPFPVAYERNRAKDRAGAGLIRPLPSPPEKTSLTAPCSHGCQRDPISRARKPPPRGRADLQDIPPSRGIAHGRPTPVLRR